MKKEHLVAILCGGKGTRMSGVEDIPKPMVEIGGMPILEHVMRIYDHFGYNRFVLLLGYKKEIIIDYFSESFPDWDIRYEDTGENTKTGRRVEKVKHLFDETFFLTYGDGLGNVDINKLLNFHKGHGGLATVATVPMPSQYGILSVGDSGKVRTFEEKPIFMDKWINAGFFVLEPEVFNYWKGEVLEGEILPNLVENGNLYAYLHEGFWKSLDTYKDHQKLDKIWSTGEAKWSVWKD